MTTADIIIANFKKDSEFHKFADEIAHHKNKVKLNMVNTVKT